MRGTLPIGAAMLWLALGCGPGQPDEAPPCIRFFGASPASMTPAGRVSLAWRVSGATRVEIEPDLGEVGLEGTREVEVLGAGTWTLRTSSAEGEVRLAKASVALAGQPIPVLDGVVVDSTGAPRGDVQVRIGDVFLQTDANGAFRARDVQAPYDAVVLDEVHGEETWYRGLTATNPTLAIDPPWRFIDGPTSFLTVQVIDLVPSPTGLDTLTYVHSVGTVFAPFKASERKDFLDTWEFQAPTTRPELSFDLVAFRVTWHPDGNTYHSGAIQRGLPLQPEGQVHTLSVEPLANVPVHLHVDAPDWAGKVNVTRMLQLPERKPIELSILQILTARDVTLNLPSFGVGQLGVFAFARSLETEHCTCNGSAREYVWLSGESLGVSLPEVPNPSVEPEELITYRTPIAWRTSPGQVCAVRFNSSGSDGMARTVVTTASSVTLAELAFGDELRERQFSIAAGCFSGFESMADVVGSNRFALSRGGRVPYRNAARDDYYFRVAPGE